MKIAELNGEKTIKTLAKHLLAEPTKKTPKTAQAKMEEALLRLNPQLDRIKELPRGAPLLVPEEFKLAREQSACPLQAMTDALLQQGEEALAHLRTVLANHAAESSAQTERMRTWLKSAQAKELQRQRPDLKEAFAGATAAARTLPKEAAAALAAQGKMLDGMQAALADFRARAAAA